MFFKYKNRQYLEEEVQHQNMLSQVHQKDLFFPTKQYVILVKILCYKAIIKNKNKNKNKVNNENVVHSDIDIMKI